ncbi:MAG: MarC family protein [Candidatus Omnitrophica bacterium]|nr:MarC family protein [Candidatus Omnitrophota bacterium]
MKMIFLACIPVFVAVDALGVLPIFISLSEGFGRKEKLLIIFHSMITALCLAFGFILLGRWIFALLGITVADFMIAGGSILFCIAITDIMSPRKKRRIPAKELGVVPLGTPLIVGPAVLTTSLMIIAEYGFLATAVSLFLNIILAGAIFLFSEVLIRRLGVTGAKALSKITSLLLASIAVMMIRKGIFQFMQ